MSAFSSINSFIVLTSLTLVYGLNKPAFAQVIPDTTLGSEASIVIPELQDGIPVEVITGGSLRGNHLFHSFL